MKQRIQALVLSIFALLTLVVIIGFLGADIYKSPQLHEMVQLEKGWTVSYASTTLHPEILQETIMPIANKDDVITLTTTLPDVNIHPAAIHFRSILSTIDIYLNDEQIYTYGHEYKDSNRMLPKYHHFVTLPDDYAGKTLKIVISACENNAFSGLAPVLLGDIEDISRQISQDGRLSLSIGVFLVMIGFVLITLSPFFIMIGNHDFSIVFSGMISLLLGLYILCFNDLFWMFSDQPAFYTFLEYFSLFALPAGILGFLTAAKQIYNRKTATVLWIINMGFAVVTSLLHVTNLVHICHFVTMLHIMAIVEGVYIIVSLSYNVYQTNKHPDRFNFKSRSTTMLIIGLLSFLGCSIIDIVKFNILKFVSVGEVNANINFLTVGAFIFIICLILNYFFHCIEYIGETNLKQQLEGLAYSDSLTGLANRSKCELTLAELQGAYSIISIDLDHLKFTNDNYGHIEGDRLLSEFGRILENSFTDASLIGRMGGDEFIVILPFVDQERTDRDLKCFTDLMEYNNSTETRIKFSASYGIANSQEKELAKILTAQNVYLLADTRMYKMKNEHHAQTLGRLYDDIIKNISPKKGGAS